MQSGSRSRIGLPERIRRRMSRRRMTDMPLSRPPEPSYLGCGFFPVIGPTPSGLCLPPATPLRLSRPNLQTTPLP